MNPRSQDALLTDNVNYWRDWKTALAYKLPNFVLSRQF